MEIKIMRNTMSKIIELHKYTARFATFAPGHYTDDYRFFEVHHFAPSIKDALKYFEELASMRGDEFVDIFQIDDEDVQ